MTGTSLPAKPAPVQLPADWAASIQPDPFLVPAQYGVSNRHVAGRLVYTPDSRTPAERALYELATVLGHRVGSVKVGAKTRRRVLCNACDYAGHPNPWHQGWDQHFLEAGIDWLVASGRLDPAGQPALQALLRTSQASLDDLVEACNAAVI